MQAEPIEKNMCRNEKSVVGRLKTETVAETVMFLAEDCSY